jgi:hypothetical protein
MGCIYVETVRPGWWIRGKHTPVFVCRLSSRSGVGARERDSSVSLRYLNTLGLGMVVGEAIVRIWSCCCASTCYSAETVQPWIKSRPATACRQYLDPEHCHGGEPLIDLQQHTSATALGVRFLVSWLHISCIGCHQHCIVSDQCRIDCADAFGMQL